MADMQSVLVRLQAAQDEMSRRNDSGELDFRMDATQFEGAYRALLSQVNDLVASHIAVKLRIVEVVSAYATGDFSVEMDRLPGQKAQITTAIDGVKASFQAMSSDVTRLVGAAVQGDFFARGDVSRYQNEFHKMVSELNRLMETTEGSLSDTGYVLEGLAKGDLTRRVTKQYQGGFGLLSTNANLTSDRLADMVEQIRASVETINVAAQEIAAGNLDLSSRTEEQAASLEETAAGMGQLAVTVKQNVGHAQEAHRLATEAGDAAFAGAALATQFNETMGRISTSATNIAGMTGLIDSIAFQTNILALNAAIEAARAGTQGNGFAVIAAEVRALSQRSTEAAKQIEKMVDESRMCANEGVTLADSSGRSMTAIINASVRVVDILSEVTGAASEQSSGIEQVNQAILQMDHVTQQNAALVEEAAAAAASLEAQAGDLDTVMRGFKLDRDTSRSTEQASPPLPSNIQLPSPVPLPIPSAPEALGFPSSNRIQRIG
jgi:methyl-accepting chemotaxis protein